MTALVITIIASQLPLEEKDLSNLKKTWSSENLADIYTWSRITFWNCCSCSCTIVKDYRGL